MSAPFRTAFQALATNKLRASLTMLGTVIGVTCVVALWNIGESGRRYIAGAISSIGRNIIFVSPRYNEDEESQRRNRYRPLSLKDAEAVRAYCPSVGQVSPVLFGGARAQYGARFFQAQLRGCYPSYLAIRDWTVGRGSAFSQADVRGANPVALLGAEVAKELFGGLDPVGAQIRLEGVPFRVLGVLEGKGSLFGDNSQDRAIYAPFTALAHHLGLGQKVHMLFVSARAREQVPQAKQEILLAIRRSQNLSLDRKDSVHVEDLGEMSRIVDNVLLGITLLLGAIGAISLLVGGIGIMNIMLVSVTERTREIGLRMALGASDGNILAQFLVEAAVLSGAGGLAGAGFGGGLAALTVKILSLVTHETWPVVIEPASLLVAVLFSGGVGIFFGFYPAWRASRLDPVVALGRA